MTSLKTIKSKYITITPFFPTPTNFRGPFVYDQIKAIQELGNYEVIVMKPKPWYSSEKDYEFDGISVFLFKTFELPSNILPGLFDSLSILFFKQKLKNIGININSIQVVHSHVTALGIFANATKKVNPNANSILQHHGFDVLSLENGKLRNVNWHRKWIRNYGIKICNAIDLHVGVSKKTLDNLFGFSKIKVKGSYVLYNGVNFEKFYFIPNSKDSNYFTISCVGNFWTLKDQITLLKATKILVDSGFDTIKVKLVGTGETVPLCKQYVIKNKLDDYIEFIDQLPHNQLVHFYNSSDLFVLPSYWEAFGCVYTEAFACGVPFIAVEGQGIAELIPEIDHSKWLIKKEDYKGLALKIQEFKIQKYKQVLNESVDINYFISKFLIHIGK
jgi:glycosyltransferase involved in cell wall biosynthesis